MLNYSEFGTEVNGQLYSCDLTDYHENENNTKKNAKTQSTIASDIKVFNDDTNLRTILDKKKNMKRNEFKQISSNNHLK